MKPASRRGITLVEMLVVVSLIGILAGISFPSVTAGVDSLRLSSASDRIAAFLNGALNRAERRQEAMEVTVSLAENAIWLRSPEPGFVRKLEMPEGVEIRAVLPETPGETGAARRILLYPGGTVPRFGVEIGNRRGARRIVRVDPTTGVPQVERPEG